MAKVTYQQRVRLQLEKIQQLTVTSLSSGTSLSEVLASVRVLAKPPFDPHRGKSKGTAYETEIGKVLGSWWWGKPFRHTPCSGGWDKHQPDGEVYAYGDLYIPPESAFPFSVECKRQEGWSLHDLVNPRIHNPVVAQWWRSAVNDAVIATNAPKRSASARVLPLLVFSRNGLGYNLVMVNPDVVSSLGALLCIHTHILVNMAPCPVVILPLETFMHLCKFPPIGKVTSASEGSTSTSEVRG